DQRVHAGGVAPDGVRRALLDHLEIHAGRRDRGAEPVEHDQPDREQDLPPQVRSPEGRSEGREQKSSWMCAGGAPGAGPTPSVGPQPGAGLFAPAAVARARGWPSNSNSARRSTTPRRAREDPSPPRPWLLLRRRPLRGNGSAAGAHTERSSGGRRGAAARSGDLLVGRTGELIGGHIDLHRQLPAAEHLHRMVLTYCAGADEFVDADRAAFGEQPDDVADIDDLVLGPPRVLEP